MWIRNKGTVANPNFVLVQSRRIAGKKHPQQETFCRMGKFRDFDGLIKIWEVVAKDARTAKRVNMTITDRNRQFPAVKTYAAKLSLKEINANLKRIRESARTYEDYLEAKKDFSPQSIEERPAELIELALLIARIRQGNLASRWKPSLRTQVKSLLAQLRNEL